MHNTIVGCCRFGALCAAVATTLVGCANKPVPAPARPEPALATAPVELDGCAERSFSSSVFDRPATAERDGDAAAVALRRVLAGDEAGLRLPSQGWRRLNDGTETVAFAHGDPPFLDGYVSFRQHPDGWRVDTAGGGCTVWPHEIGSFRAVWAIDTAAGPPPGRDATSIAVVVNDLACAGGQGPEKRLREPNVRVTGDTVVVTFTSSPSGYSTCPSHKAVRRVVSLPEPLGKRTLLDGGVYPPQRPCPDERRRECQLLVV